MKILWHSSAPMFSESARAKIPPYQPDLDAVRMPDDDGRQTWNPGGYPEVTHLCPPEGSGVMPCCGRTPLEVPTYHRLTLDPALATCTGNIPTARIER